MIAAVLFSTDHPTGIWASTAPMTLISSQGLEVVDGRHRCVARLLVRTASGRMTHIATCRDQRERTPLFSHPVCRRVRESCTQALVLKVRIHGNHVDLAHPAPWFQDCCSETHNAVTDFDDPDFRSLIKEDLFNVLLLLMT